MSTRPFAALVRLLTVVSGIAIAAGLAVPAAGAATTSSRESPNAVIRESPPTEGGINVALPMGRTIRGTVKGADGTTLAGASVSACRTGQQVFDCGSASSAADGTFAIVGLVPGTYTVRAMPNESPYVGGWFGPNGYAAQQSDGSPVSVVTTDVSGISFALPLSSLTIGGKVTGTGAGAAGIGGARVSACPTGGGTCPGARTASDGAFSIAGLTQGRYTLLVTAPPDSSFPAVSYYQGPGKPVGSWSNAMPLTLGASSLTGIMIMLPVLPSITGRLMGPGDRPVAGASIVGCALSCAIGMTQLDGSYELRGVGSGNYLFSFTRPQGSSFASGNFGPTGFTPYWGPFKALTVGTAPVVAPTVIVPEETLSIGGVATGVGIGPVANVIVTACAKVSAAAYGPQSCESGMTLADGSFVVPVLVPGLYTIGFRAPRGSNLEPGYYSKTLGWVAAQTEATQVPVGTVVGPRLVASAPRANQTNVKRTVKITLRFNVDVITPDAHSVALMDVMTGKSVGLKVAYNRTMRTATLTPLTKLAAARLYVLYVSSPPVINGGAVLATSWLPVPAVQIRFVTGTS
jgi:hypothetical protein